MVPRGGRSGGGWTRLGGIRLRARWYELREERGQLHIIEWYWWFALFVPP